MHYRAAFLLKSPQYARQAPQAGLRDRPTQLERLRRIHQFGTLHQMWAPTCHNSVRRELSDLRRDLIFDGWTFRPFGMSEEYWEALKERVGTRGHGWIDGVLRL